MAIPLASLCLSAGDTTYHSLAIDKSGQLYITLDDGRSVRAPKLHNQVSFESPKISADHRTVGWLVDYPDPFAPAATNPVQGALVLYRSGRIIHAIVDTDQVFWDWQFQDKGKHVAYSTGPTHGGAYECTLIDTISATVIARWPVTPDGAAPDWARSLRR